MPTVKNNGVGSLPDIKANGKTGINLIGNFTAEQKAIVDKYSPFFKSGIDINLSDYNDYLGTTKFYKDGSRSIDITKNLDADSGFEFVLLHEIAHKVFNYDEDSASDYANRMIEINKNNNINNMATQSVPYKFYKTYTNGIASYEKMPGFNTPYGYQEVSVDEYNKATGKKETSNQPSDYINVDGTMWNKKDYDKTQASIASGYTGETAGKTQGGQILYKLKDGTVTTTPPNGNNSNSQGAYMSDASQPDTKPKVGIVGDIQTFADGSQLNLKTNEVIANAGGAKEITPTDFTKFPKANENTGFDTIAPEDKKWINDLYQKYFDRTATSSEIANWSKENPQSLEQFLQKEQKTYGYVSNAQKGTNDQKLKDAIAVIDSSNLPDEIKALWKQTVALYPDATDFQPTEIINTFNKIKSETIDPYFKELTDVATKDIQTTAQQLSGARTTELEAEQALAQKNIDTSKSNLEKTGMTFTGEGVKQLGTGSAYAAAGAEAPVQTPFGGIDASKLSGSVGQSNRLISTSTAARYAASQQELGRKAEDYLGQQQASALGLNYTPAGVKLTSQLETDKQGKYAGTLNQIIANWRNKQNLKTNI